MVLIVITYVSRYIIASRDSFFMTNYGNSYYKSGQHYYKLEQTFKNQGSFYKSMYSRNNSKHK